MTSRNGKQDPETNGKADPFDPAAIRLNGSLDLGVKRAINHIPAMKPPKHEFVRVHPDESYRVDTAVFVDEQTKDSYLIAADLREDLADIVTPVRLCAAVTRHRNPFLWLAKLPTDDARPNRWTASMLEAQTEAIESWVRVRSDMTIGEYVAYIATGNLPDPVWPEMDFGEMLRLCFRTRYIESNDHPILQSLRGEV